MNIEEELLQTDDEEEEQEDYDVREEEEVKRLDNFLQRTVLPLLNTEINLFEKQTSSKLKEKVKNLEGKVERKSHKNAELANSLELANGRLHKKEQDFEDLVKENKKVSDENKKLKLAKDFLVESLKAENDTIVLYKEKIQNGISKIAKKDKEIANLKEQVQNGVSMIGNLEEQVGQEKRKNTQLAKLAKNKQFKDYLLGNKEKEIANLKQVSLFKDAMLAECRKKLKEAETKLSKESTLLGKGAFGEVYKETMPMAVKKIKNLNAEPEKEVKTLMGLSHENIIRYYSHYLETDADGETPRLCIAMEFAGAGTLTDTVRREAQNSETTFFWESNVWAILENISSALNYLHTLPQPIFR